METKLCKCCGRERPLDSFATHVNRDGSRKLLDICNECMGDKIKAGRKKKTENIVASKDEEIRKARSLRLNDFTPRELMERLRDLGYTGKLNYVETHVIDLENI